MFDRRRFSLQALGALLAAAFSARRAHGDIVSYTYDDLGRLVRAEYSSGATINYTYDAAGNRTEVEVVGVPPATATLSASPAAINLGASSTLSWTTTNATSASINNGVGAVTPIAGGSVSVTPSATTTYTLTAAGPGGQALPAPQAAVTINPPTGTFVANPAAIVQGASSTLSWTSANATGASINQGIGAVTPVAGGSRSVSPAVTTAYTLTLTGPSGQITRQATVTVTPPAFTATIQITGTAAVNLRALADAAGYDGARAAQITFQLASNVSVTGGAGAPNGGAAVNSGTWPSGYAHAILLQISGKVRGGGGRGGNGAGSQAGLTGGLGGDAIYCQVPMSITVNSSGEVRGGGGGGGGGGGRWSTPQEFDRVGGGGGGGFPNGAAGTKGNPFLDGDSTGAADGAPGTTSGGGAGGNGEINGGGRGGNGGGPGAQGQPGTAGSGAGSVRDPGSLGQAGYAIRKNGNTVTVTNNGTINGTVG